MMARSKIAPPQRPDTLMQLSRSSILAYRTAGPYILAHLVSLIYIPPFEWSARRFGEILCLRGGIWNSILKRVLPFSRRLCKSEERFFLPAGCLHSSKFEDACKSGCRMDWSDYLRDEAAKYRQLAEKAEDPSVKQDLLDLAVVCEDVANDIEDRIPGG